MKNWFNSLWDDSAGLGCFATILIYILMIGLIVLENALGVWLWSVLVVAKFAAPALGFWEFLGLRVLVHIIFKLPVSLKFIQQEKE